MTHYSRLTAIVIDVPADQHPAEVAFWQAATGTELTQFAPHPEYHGGHLGREDVDLLVQRLGSGPARVHLDFHTDDVAAEVARLQALGATKVSEDGPWFVLSDPAGLPVCVVPAPAGTLDDSNAMRWD